MMISEANASSGQTR